MAADEQRWALYDEEDDDDDDVALYLDSPAWSFPVLMSHGSYSGHKSVCWTLYWAIQDR